MAAITFDPYIPLALWVPLALAAAALLATYGWTGRRRLPQRRWIAVMSLMTLAVAVPLLLLLNPTWLEQVPPPPGKPLLTVLVDRSASMATADAEEGRTRYEAACQLAAQVAAQLGEAYDVRLRWFAEGSAPVAPGELPQRRPDGALTDIAAAVEASLDETRPQGQALLLLSDGIHNAAGGSGRLREAVAKAKAMAAPIYTLPIGGAAAIDDVEVGLERPQELAFVGQRLPVVVRIRQRGGTARPARLSLRLEGKQVEDREVKLVADGAVDEVFYLTQKAAGLYRYEVSADPLAGEVTDLNNTAALMLRVVDQPIRVLLLEGKPYWDTKFLVRTLAADPSIELTSVVQLREGRLLRRQITRPPQPPAGDDKAEPKPPETRNDQWTIETDAGRILADPQTLPGYEIVVLGRDAEVFLTDEALGRLKKWLVHGDGSLVCFRGPPTAQVSQRLGELMPVRWAAATPTEFHVRWTPAGQSLRWLPAAEGDDPLADLPSLATATRPEKPKTLAVVLATAVGAAGEATPVISYQPLGSGRVVVVEGAGMWRWAFLPPQSQQHDDVYGGLWRSLVRWLVGNVGLLPSQQLALRADKATFATTESATATLLLRESRLEKPVPEIELTGGALPAPRRIVPVPRGGSPGEFYVPLGLLPEGRYRARVVGEDDVVAAVAAFDVRGSLRERLDVRAQPDVVAMVAQQSGGEVLAKADPRLLARQFDAQLVRSRPARRTQTMAWDRWWALLAGLSLWAVCWGLRRSSGLV